MEIWEPELVQNDKCHFLFVRSFVFSFIFCFTNNFLVGSCFVRVLEWRREWRFGNRNWYKKISTTSCSFVLSFFGYFFVLLTISSCRFVFSLGYLNGAGEWKFGNRNWYKMISTTSCSFILSFFCLLFRFTNNFLLVGSCFVRVLEWRREWRFVNRN